MGCLSIIPETVYAMRMEWNGRVSEKEIRFVSHICLARAASFEKHKKQQCWLDENPRTIQNALTPLHVVEWSWLVIVQHCREET